MQTATELNTKITRGHWHAVFAGFLGWTLDAFDFFVVIFLVDTLAGEFHVTKTKIILTITATLVIRPVGALILGLLADRLGRGAPLMPTNTIEYALRDRFGYQGALAGFEIMVILLLMTVTLMGTENMEKSFVTMGTADRG